MTKGTAQDITVRQLTKTHGAVRALDGVDLDVRAGEFLTLLGPSGSGKTTLLMVLAGFIRPDHGSVLFGGQEVLRLAPHKRNVGMVFQNYALFPHMDVAANIAFPLQLRKVPREEIARRVEAALAMVQLSGYGARRVDQLSGGQRQRVAVARAIVFEPRIVLMDEPLSALDKQLRELMQIELRQLHESLGMTTIYVTHDQREALTMSDRVAVIDHGRLMQLDTPRRIYEAPTNRFVASFIGESSFLPVDVRDGTCTVAGVPLRTDAPCPEPGRCWLLLRPERLRLLPPGEPPPGFNVFEGKLAAVVYQGDTLLLQVRLAAGTTVGVRLVAGREAFESVPAQGTPVRLGLAVSDTVLLAGMEGAG